MKKLAFLIICTLFGNIIAGQITLDQVLKEVRAYAPESKMSGITDKKVLLEVENLNKQRLPQLSVYGQSTYQSDVTFLDVNIPGISIEAPSEFQYKLQAEIGQIIYDGGNISLLKKAKEIESEITRWQVELDLEKLWMRTIDLFFNLLEVQEQFEILQSRKEDLNVQIERLKAAVENGVMLESELQELQAMMIQLDQNEIDLVTQNNILLNLLNLLTGQNYTMDQEYSIPGNVLSTPMTEIKQAYYQILEWHKKGIDNQLELKQTGLNPIITGFGQFGLGKPGLNFLNNDFTDYYLVGLRFKMNLGNLYTESNDKQIMALKKEEIAHNKSVFDRKVNSSIAEYEGNILRFDKLIKSNQQLLALKEDIYKVAEAEFENGVMNSADYLTKFNEVARVKLSIGISRIRKLKNEYLLQHITGRYQ